VRLRKSKEKEEKENRLFNSIYIIFTRHVFIIRNIKSEVRDYIFLSQDILCVGHVLG
jgi:hypothetical protein